MKQSQKIFSTYLYLTGYICQCFISDVEILIIILKKAVLFKERSSNAIQKF